MLLGILLILAGLGAGVLAFTIREFYAAKGVVGAAGSSRKLKRWQGRVIYLAVAIALIGGGLSILLHQ